MVLSGISKPEDNDDYNVATVAATPSVSIEDIPPTAPEYHPTHPPAWYSPWGRPGHSGHNHHHIQTWPPSYYSPRYPSHYSSAYAPPYYSYPGYGQPVPSHPHLPSNLSNPLPPCYYSPPLAAGPPVPADQNPPNLVVPEAHTSYNEQQSGPYASPHPHTGDKVDELNSPSQPQNSTPASQDGHSGRERPQQDPLGHVVTLLQREDRRQAEYHTQQVESMRREGVGEPWPTSEPIYDPTEWRLLALRDSGRSLEHEAERLKRAADGRHRIMMERVARAHERPSVEIARKRGTVEVRMLSTGKGKNVQTGRGRTVVHQSAEVNGDPSSSSPENRKRQRVLDANKSGSRDASEESSSHDVGEDNSMNSTLPLLASEPTIIKVKDAPDGRGTASEPSGQGLGSSVEVDDE